MKDLRTIILAAGKGTRMKSGTPKVLHKVLGRPLIDYVLDVARVAGASKIYAVIGHEAGQVRSHLSGIQVVIQDKLLGTADALKRCRSAFKNYRGDVLVLCGDTVLLRAATVRQVIQKHRRTRPACTFLTAEVMDASGYGRIIRDTQGRAIAIREEKDATSEERAIREINVGVYCFDSRKLFRFIGSVKENPKKKEFYLTDLIALLAQEGLRVETVATDDVREGLGINDRADLAYATQEMRQRVLNDFMRNGVTIVDPATTFIYPGVKIGRDTIIRPFTLIENDVQIGKECIIGPAAHLRPGTRLGNRVEVGNFVEVSRSTIGDGCLQKHFSFVGDATVGAGTNIGAGTVTANYDGKSKNRTRIGRRAFIGSDSILVAPVTVSDEAVTGAGCVVTKGTVVPRRGIAVGVPARIIKKR